MQCVCTHVLNCIFMQIFLLFFFEEEGRFVDGKFDEENVLMKIESLVNVYVIHKFFAVMTTYAYSCEKTPL